MDNPISRINMIKQQLRTGNIKSDKIIALYEAINREFFVPAQAKHFAYSDLQIPLAHSERMMTPLEEATLLQALNLKGHETVLEIGTGSGFLTALLSKLCKKVVSIDCYKDFTTAAIAKLTEFECTNVQLFTGDGANGWMDLAPYDAVIFTGGLPILKEIHKLQVVPGGQLFAPIGTPAVMQGQLHQLDHQGNWQETLLFETQLPFLLHAQETDHFVF